MDVDAVLDEPLVLLPLDALVPLDELTVAEPPPGVDAVPLKVPPLLELSEPLPLFRLPPEEDVSPEPGLLLVSALPSELMTLPGAELLPKLVVLADEGDEVPPAPELCWRTCAWFCTVFAAIWPDSNMLGSITPTEASPARPSIACVRRPSPRRSRPSDTNVETLRTKRHFVRSNMFMILGWAIASFDSRW